MVGHHVWLSDLGRFWGEALNAIAIQKRARGVKKMSALRKTGLIEFKNKVRDEKIYFHTDDLAEYKDEVDDEMKEAINYILEWLLELEEEMQRK